MTMYENKGIKGHCNIGQTQWVILKVYAVQNPCMCQIKHKAIQAHQKNRKLRLRVQLKAVETITNPGSCSCAYDNHRHILSLF